MNMKIIALFLIVLLLAMGCAKEQPVEEVEEIEETEDEADEESVVYEVPGDELEEDETFVVEGVEEPETIVEPVEEVVVEAPVAVPKVNGARLNIDSWMIQLSEYDIDDMQTEGADLYVVDREELANDKLSPEELDGYVLAYLNIGEVIRNKDYWDRDWGLGNPAWIDRKTGGKWDNYRAQYWQEPWQMIIIDQMDKILDAGYDGVYLDGVEHYPYFQSYSGVNSNGAMIEFVKKVSSYGKDKNSKFIVMVQEGLELTDDGDYLAAIDGYAEEELWYDGSVEINDFDIEEKLAKLDELRKSKTLLVLDYPATPGKVCNFVGKASSHRFAGYAGAVFLDRATNWGCD